MSNSLVGTTDIAVAPEPDVVSGEDPGDAILGARFLDIPEGVAVVGNVASGRRLREVMGSIPPSDVVIERGSFTLIYRFPRSSSKRLEEAMRDLAALMAEGASTNGLEVYLEDGGDELLVLRIRRVLHPSEAEMPIGEVLREYARRLEDYVAGFLDGAT